MHARLHRGLIIAAAFTALVCSPALAQGGKPLSADLEGEVEVPVTGDLDATGHATLRLNSGQGTVCYNITVESVAPIFAAHVHSGSVGQPGPIVVNLPPANGVIAGCTTGVARDLIKDIRQNPSNYYVNVHNMPFPGGAARGQLDHGS